MTVKSHLKSAILQDNITTWDTNVETSIAPEFSHFFDKLLSAVKFAL